MSQALPLLWLSLSFILGILLGDWQPLHSAAWIGMVVFCLVFTFFEERLSWLRPFQTRWKRISPLPLGIILAVLFLGAARYQAAQPEFSPRDLAWYNGRDVRLTAIITGYPEAGTRSTPLRLKTSQLELEGQAPLEVNGLLVAVLPPGEDLRYGDILQLVGRLTMPGAGGDFSYSGYLARQGIHAQMLFPKASLVGRGSGNPLKAALFALRSAADRTIKNIFPAPESALLSGILLGLDGDLPPGLKNAFRDTGTSHIIAISGFNIAILAGLFTLLASRVFPNRWLAFGASIAGIIFYTVLVGAQASVVRAAVMGGLGLFGQHIGRRRFGLNILGFTAAVMSLANPWVLWDISFQLSFAATLGLVLYADRMQGWFIRLLKPHLGATADRLAGPAGEYILFTLAAQLTTLPVLVYHFHRLSLITLIANPLILPPQPLVMILGGMVTLIGMIFPPLGKLFALLIWPLLAYTTRLVEWLASFSSSLTLGETTWWGVLLFYILLFSLTYKPSILAPWRWLRVETGLLVLALLTGLTWRAALSAADGDLHLVLFNSGGNAVSLVRAPGGQSVLINGGVDSRMLSAALGRRLSPIDPHLDAFILTTTSANGMGGLDIVLGHFPPKQALLNDAILDSKTGLRVLETLGAVDTRMGDIKSGQVIQLGEGAELQTLVSTESGTALLLEFGNFRALQPGGVSPKEIKRHGKLELEGLTLLILGETDLANQPSADWTALRPQASLWIGEGSAPEAGWISLAFYEWVEFTSNGNTFSVKASR